MLSLKEVMLESCNCCIVISEGEEEQAFINLEPHEAALIAQAIQERDAEIEYMKHQLAYPPLKRLRVQLEAAAVILRDCVTVMTNEPLANRRYWETRDKARSVLAEIEGFLGRKK